MQQQRQLSCDVETTGLDYKQGHRIIEIGLREMINRHITGKYYHVYINPEREIDRGAQMIHGITQDFLQDKPIFSEIVQSLLDFIQEDELIIHNAPFDVGFLNYELQLLKNNYKPIDEVCSIIDTLTLARQKYPGQKNSLDALCRRLNINNSSRNLHGALLDAGLLSQVYLAMTGGQVQLFQTEGSKTMQADFERHIRRLSPDRLPLKVIRASASELMAHRQFLEKVDQV